MAAGHAGVWRAAAVGLALLAACDGSSTEVDGAGGQPDAAVPRANGTVQAWVKLAAMPLPRANHCAAAVNGFLVVVGGNYKPAGSADFVKTDAVHVARINGDGSLGAWKQAGKARGPVTECGAADLGTRLVVVHGLYEQTSDQGQVWIADLSSDGVLGAWASAGSLPAGRATLSPSVWSTGSTLLVSSSVAPQGGAESTAILRAEIKGGAAGTWSVDEVMAEFRGRAQYAFDGKRAWVLGGYRSAAHGNETVTDGRVSVRGATGAFGASTSAGSLPAPRAFGAAVAVDEHVFVVGGREAMLGAPGQATVYAARAGADGKLGTFKATAALPEGRTNHRLVHAGSFLYLTGGGGAGPGQDNVWAGRVRF